MSGIIGGIFAGCIVQLVRIVARNASASFDGASNTHVARYPLIARAITWLLMIVPVGLWVALLTVTAADQVVVRGCVCLALTAAAVILLREVNVARATWSESRLVFQSPWRKAQSIGWQDVTEVYFSRAASWVVIRGRAGVRIRLSSLLGGLPELFQALRANAAPALGPDIEKAFSQWRSRAARWGI
jgi:hypothetical protein